MRTQPETDFQPLFQLQQGLRLILASASPRRRLFLRQWGLPFQICLPEGPEPRPLPHESPVDYTRRAAAAKARAAEQTAAQTTGQAAAQASTQDAECHNLILAADTVVAVDDTILGKPRHREEALTMLESLNGRGHQVISAVCLLLPQGHSQTRQLLFHDVSHVFFHHWPREVLAAYARTGEPDDKAGAYAIQGQGAFLVDRIEGSWSTVVGLPVTQLAQCLLRQGLMHAVHGQARPLRTDG